MEKGQYYFKGKNVNGTYLLCNQTDCKVKHVIFKWIWKNRVKDHIINSRYSCWILGNAEQTLHLYFVNANVPCWSFWANSALVFCSPAGWNIGDWGVLCVTKCSVLLLAHLTTSNWNQHSYSYTASKSTPAAKWTCPFPTILHKLQAVTKKKLWNTASAEKHWEFCCWLNWGQKFLQEGFTRGHVYFKL